MEKEHNHHTLWYEQPASTWEQALPIGNGRLGAMVGGSTDIDHLWMNEDSVWYGGPQQRTNPAARDSLPVVRKLIQENKVKEAEELLRRDFTSMPRSMRHYEPLGDVFLDFSHGRWLADKGMEFAGIPDLTRGPATEAVGDYRRSLDISTGVAETRYTHQGVEYKREYFASVTDEVVCVRVSASREGSVTFKIRVHRGIHDNPHQELNCIFDGLEAIPGGLLLKAKLGGQNANDAVMGVHVVVEGDAECLVGEEIVVSGADSAMVFIAGETSYRNADPRLQVLARLEQASRRPWQDLYTRHTVRFASLYSRVSFDLGHSTGCSLPTDERLTRVKAGEIDSPLVALLVCYARYLLISCSLSGLPANLQGIWNQDFHPAWGSKYTININLQMNYWPAEVLNLSECHQPLFEHIYRLSVNGKKVARDMYGCRGFVVHHNTDIWADCSVQDRYTPASYWQLGGAWLCTHLWEHYLFTQDTEFLRWAFPILQDAAIFFEDFLIETDGQLVVSPSVSCENSYYIPGTREAAAICVGAAWDSQILYELFNGCAEASRILGHPASAEKYCLLTSKLPKPKVGKHGQLMEWMEDFEEAEPGHRHISHAFGLYPGSSIKSDMLKDALRVTLQRRLSSGGGHTGWSAAWLVCLYARLRDPEGAHGVIQQMLQHSILENLFDDHPPFQIDGNFGLAAGVAEMVLQSHEAGGVIHLLPCLPKSWGQEGSVTGLCARGGLVIDIMWKDGRLVRAKITAVRGKFEGKCRINQSWLKAGSTELTLCLEDGESKTLTDVWPN